MNIIFKTLHWPSMPSMLGASISRHWGANEVSNKIWWRCSTCYPLRTFIHSILPDHSQEERMDRYVRDAPMVVYDHRCNRFKHSQNIIFMPKTWRWSSELSPSLEGLNECLEHHDQQEGKGWRGAQLRVNVALSCWSWSRPVRFSHSLSLAVIAANDSFLSFIEREEENGWREKIRWMRHTVSPTIACNRWST